MKKRFVLLTISFIFAFCCCVPIGGPALASAEPEAILQPYLTYINTANCTMSINSSGRASMSATLIAYTGLTDQIRISSYLQRYQNGAWTVVNNWSQTTEGTSAAWSQSYYVSSGYNYRLRTYFYTYDGSSIIESTSATSSSVYY